MLLRIAVQLSHQYTIGRLGVLVGTVSLEVVFHLSATIELISSSQIPALHLMVDGLHIYQTTLAEVEVNACPQELLSQQGHVEVVAVITGNIRTSKHLTNLARQLLEGGLVLDILIGDARQRHDLIGNRLLWIDNLITPLFTTVGVHLNI